jgi:SAM-dependent methyltransferase
MGAKEHWEAVYRTKSISKVSWFQPEARVSLDLITRVAPLLDSPIIDVRGGSSTLVDGLLSRKYWKVTVLDIAPAAIDAARMRLGSAAKNARWIVANVLTHPFLRHSVDVWHDRAVFHFLTSPEDRRTYVGQVTGALRPNGHVIVATFAADGPTRCSGLDTCRYDLRKLRNEFGASFELIGHMREEHITPSGVPQRFQYCVCTYRPEESGAA